jgi:hypothetical protein
VVVVSIHFVRGEPAPHENSRHLSWILPGRIRSCLQNVSTCMDFCESQYVATPVKHKKCGFCDLWALATDWLDFTTLRTLIGLRPLTFCPQSTYARWFSNHVRFTWGAQQARNKMALA